MTKGVVIKTSNDIKIMAEGGKKLATIKKRLMKDIREGVSAKAIDDLAERLIKKSGGSPSFKMVENYNWTTCINVNEGIVHGIPKTDVMFKKEDVVSVDVGMFYKGFHTDTSFTLGLNAKPAISNFLAVGKKALSLAISQAKPGKRIYDISDMIEKTVRKSGYSPIKALVGHGVGRELHEEPQIPCFVSGKPGESPIIRDGWVIAIEVMYVQGSSEVKIEEDGWTISTSDGKISALFEETVAVTKNGPIVLTN